MTIPQGDPYQVLNYGGGVQSTALLTAACLGDLPKGVKPDIAIFANTQWEPPGVIETVKRMTEWAQVQGIEVCTVTHGSIRTARGANCMPLFIRHDDGSGGIIRRQCTEEYKIKPIRREVRRRLGYAKGQRWRRRLETWLGISIDEAQRMKPSQQSFETARWPLIELDWSREDCKRYLEKQGLPVPMKSSCVGCPYHSNRYFLEMKKNRPVEWESAVAFDRQLRQDNFRQRIMIRGEPFLHRSLIPLEEVYLQEDQIDLFGEECSGYCTG
jgi:hypothetical protein